MLKEATMPPAKKSPENRQPENRQGVPAKQRDDVKNPLQPDAEGLEDLNLTRPAPIDVERQEASRLDTAK
jgi:hypothetical protein